MSPEADLNEQSELSWVTEILTSSGRAAEREALVRATSPRAMPNNLIVRWEKRERGEGEDGKWKREARGMANKEYHTRLSRPYRKRKGERQ